MICEGIWRTEGGFFVRINKMNSRKQWEGDFINKDGKKIITGYWNNNGDYYMSGIDQYRLMERMRGGEEKGEWPNVPQM